MSKIGFDPGSLGLVGFWVDCEDMVVDSVAELGWDLKEAARGLLGWIGCRHDLCVDICGAVCSRLGIFEVGCVRRKTCSSLDMFEAGYVRG